MFTKAIFIVLSAVVMQRSVEAQTSQPATAAQTAPKVKYGANPAAGDTFTHDGVKLYYEVYGSGEPLLLVHGNGGSIGDFRAQIDHFRKQYR
jgi:hypothetical protein